MLDPYKDESVYTQEVLIIPEKKLSVPKSALAAPMRKTIRELRRERILKEVEQKESTILQHKCYDTA